MWKFASQVFVLFVHTRWNLNWMHVFFNTKFIADIIQIMIYTSCVRVKLCVLNTQSMRNKSDEFVDFVLQNNLDLVAISETWFKPDDNLVPHECTPAGYSLHHIPRPKKTGGGVALLFRSSLSVSMKNDNIDYLTFESLHAEITCNSRSVRLVNIYRPERDVDGKHVNFSSFLQEF